MPQPPQQQQQNRSSSTASGKTEIRNHELLALKAFVTAKDANPYDDVHATTILLDLTHSNLIQRHLEIRFDLMQDTLATLRQRIHQKTGTPPSMQHLQIKHNSVVAWDLPPNSPFDHYKLGYFGLEHGTNVHCIDLDPHSASRHGGYEDVSLVPKYVMSEDDYHQRTNTLRHWKRQQQAQQPDFTLERHAQQHQAMVEAKRCHRLGMPLPDGFVYDAQLKQVVVVKPTTAATAKESTAVALSLSTTTPPAEHFQVGQRCEVRPGGRRGVVRFVGIIPNMGQTATKTDTLTLDNTTTTTGNGDDNHQSRRETYWIGVEFDEPVGKSDGSFQGKQYFGVVGPRYGGFCLPQNVQVGDFPERDLFNDDEEGDDDDDKNDEHWQKEGEDDNDDDEL